MERVPVKITERGFVPLKRAAWVPIPRRIIFRSRDRVGNVRLMAHELMHVLQADRYGWAWPLVYVAQWVVTGFRYRQMPFEVEARAAEGDPDMIQWARDVIRDLRS